MQRTNRPPTRSWRRAVTGLARFTVTLGISACGAEPTALALRPEQVALPAAVRVNLDRSGFLSGAGGVPLFYQLVGNGPDTVVVLHGGRRLTLL